MSRVDVIVPCYNYGHFLRQCVESILAQLGVDVRVLIIDDTSPDNTPDVATELVQQDARVEYRRHASNQGHISTYNEGIDWASGEYMLLLSADDVLIPGSLYRAVDLMERHPKVGLTYGQAVNTPDPSKEAVKSLQIANCKVESGASFLKQSCVEGMNLVPTPTAVVRTRLQKSIGHYRRDLPHTADMEMWLRFAAHSWVGMFDSFQAYYRIHGTNMSQDYKGVGDMRARLAAFDMLFREFGHRIEGVDDLERLAKRALLLETFRTVLHQMENGEPESVSSYLKFAQELDPLHWRQAWFLYRSKCRCKRFLGPRGVAALRPFRKGIRNVFDGVGRMKSLAASPSG
jgi:glycosyltransferase involved in cell wall biosynthesis